MRGAIYVEDSKNSKIAGDGKADATYTSISKTCSHTCPLKDEGCYAQSSYVGLIVGRLNRRARQHSPLEVARAEARCIDEAYHGGEVPAGRDLRIHISGDSRSVKGTRAINAAVGRWKKRGGNVAWSYTHSFKKISSKEWNNVSILASIESPEQVKEARKMGYAPALVVAEHPSEKAYKLPGSNTKWIPCVQQTRGVPCVKCRLCFDADRLYEQNMGIAFAAHGSRKNVVKRHLPVLQK